MAERQWRSTEKRPWHELGTSLDAPATAAEAITSAGLDYEVELNGLETLDGIPVPQRRAVVGQTPTRCSGLSETAMSRCKIANASAFSTLWWPMAASGITRPERWEGGNEFGCWRNCQTRFGSKTHTTLWTNSCSCPTPTMDHRSASLLHARFGWFAKHTQHGRGPIEWTRNHDLAQGDLTSKIREAQRVLGLAEQFYDDAGAKIDRLASFFRPKNSWRTSSSLLS